MKFQVWAQTDVGLKRDINQDSILVDHDINLYIVADGMGGHKGGEVASALAVETMQEYVKKHALENRLSPRRILANAYKEASARIHHKSTYENPELMGMGTTMVAIWAVGDKIYIGNVGDSRAYLFKSPNLWQLTEDHSLINEQVKAGIITEEDAPHVVGRNVITRSVGFERDVVVDVLERTVAPGDIYLLCSDGLSGLVSGERIGEMLRAGPLPEVVAKCIKEAKKAGGDDNVSVIVVTRV